MKKLHGLRRTIQFQVPEVNPVRLDLQMYPIVMTTTF